ncbi:hypothetical protein [Phycisphaera mikurensis]|uniref:Uncharacterized protein n=1 Tax=Phycisphaera mikurensis (strain NBRC 102666 / KCTC 22515 / FYK2301M01) TaxID=1142394 RepID=I0IG39_PHYMF|nr:hypothetical protein [Phycisphaera mikurensis]MBB6440390.1 hypothetical protein [Phycisphaera mikurensis]BAM04227.1 hypothetical protein PSMK_20680 [Phycisphaera mikurensis NBRC 102666]
MNATRPQPVAADRPTASRTGGAAGRLSVEEASARLAALREKIRDTEEDLDRGAGDAAGGSSARGGHLEEWASADFRGDQPPAGVLWSRVTAARAAGSRERKLIVWVGDWCWLNPRAVDGTPDDWLWLKTARQADRVWAVELCCRNPAVSVVVADGRGLPMAATRRLQLAARAGGVRVLLARTPEELAMPSAAPVRGIVGGRVDEEEDAGWPRRLHAGPDTDPTAACAVAEGRAGDPHASPRRVPSPPRWNARLLRRKGLRPTDDAAETPDLMLSGAGGGDGWVVEKRHATMVVRSPDRLADRPLPAEAAGHRRAG